MACMHVCGGIAQPSIVLLSHPSQVGTIYIACTNMAHFTTRGACPRHGMVGTRHCKGKRMVLAPGMAGTRHCKPMAVIA